MEYAGGEGRICLSLPQHLFDVGDSAGSAGSDDRNRQEGSHFRICLAGIAVLCPVVVHRGEKDFARSPFLDLCSPGKQFPVRFPVPPVSHHLPLPVRSLTGIYGHHHELGSIVGCYLPYQFRMLYSGGIDGYLVRSRIQEAGTVLEGRDSPSHRERNVYSF